jgi:LPS-assembly lipoprotein
MTPLIRRHALVLAAALGMAGLSGCGFQLRSSLELPFATIAVLPEKTGGVAGDMTRYLGERVRPRVPVGGGPAPDVTLDILQESREKVVVGVNASGQVREYELRMKVNFRLRDNKGDELIAPSFIEQRRSISFNESVVLSKETEEALLYKDMQSDIVQQLMRRLAAVKPKGAASAAAN